MNKHFIKDYNRAMKKTLNSERKTINRAIESINKSEKIKENLRNKNNKLWALS